MNWLSNSDRVLTISAVTVAFALSAAPAKAEGDPVAEAIIDYMDFATYEAGIILPAQLDETVFQAASFVDTRDAEQYAAGHIPGAIHIEWREIPGRIDELPEGMVILYCNTGSLSAQAAFAARVMGHENVLVMQGGLLEWQNSGAFRP
jgi:rhodanese-related sulfurtransferase